MQDPNNANAVAQDSNKNGATPYVSMEVGVQEQFKDEESPNDDGHDQLSTSQSIAESVMTADGIHDMTGFYIICLVILIGDMSRGVFFPSMWPLVDSLGGTSVTLGYSVAAFSFGRILVSPLFGRWSFSYGYSKTLLFSCSILLLGTFMYAQVQNVGRPEFLILAQTCLGIGSGTLGVTRAFVAEVTAQRNRTQYMALITAVQYGGFTVTPIFGAIFIKILQNSDFQYGPFRLNMFTAPAYFMSCVIIVTIVLMRIYFQDRVRFATQKQSKKSKKRATIDDYANSITWIGLTVYDCCILGCMALNVSTKGSISSFETLGVSIAELNFDMDSSRAGAIVAGCGAVGVAALLSMGYLSQLFSDIQLIGGGMVIMATGILSLTGLDQDAANSGWRFFIAIFMIYAVGYPIGHTALIGLFSKIVGKRPQGELLGWFASAGSFARLSFPIMSGYVATYSGITTLFLVLTVVLTASCFACFYARQTLLLLSS